ncbi:MAG: hypothetical protein RBG13Loki_3380 [Promethearchaeota archaeon CR_4]|nr:MAG: hypothetical protein RBG13Loki_3380 [Candidatus Lokiarchaeota archaeon CR_4]
MLEIMEVAIPSYFLFSPNTPNDDDPTDDDKAMARAIVNLSFLQFFSERFNTELLPNFSTIVQKFGNKSLFDQEVERHRVDFTKLSDKQAWRRIQRTFHSRPFEDAGIQRIVRWKELGIEWNISWENTYELTAFGEQYACLLQIVLTHVAGVDLCLLPTSINLTIENSSDSGYHAIPLPSNKGRIWRIQVPHSKSYTTAPPDYLPSILTTVTHLLFENSILPQHQFILVWKKNFEEAFQLGIFLGNSYEEIYKHFIPQKAFNEDLRKKTIVPLQNMKFRLWASKELGWISPPGPTYSKEGAQIALQKRYEKSSQAIKLTLPKLLKSSEILQSIQSLKDDGWLDWQIMLALANITLNYRLNIEGLDPLKNRSIYQTRMLEDFEKDESETAINVPLGEYTKENIIAYFHMNMLASVRALELEHHQRTPDIPAIKRFLKERYKYFEDDIPHKDPFRFTLKKPLTKKTKKITKRPSKNAVRKSVNILRNK